MRRNSVDRFSRPLTLAMISERFDGENTSATVRLVLGQRALDLQRMATDEFGRERVAYHQRDGLLPRGQIECVTAWKTLKKRSLAHRDGPILLRMQKATLGWIETSARDGGCHRIPRHTPIDIFESVALLMAIQLPTSWQIAPASAVLRNVTDQLQNLFRASLLWNIVKTIPALSGFRHPSDGAADSPCAACLDRELDIKAATGKKNESSSPLRNAIARGIFNLECDTVTELAEARAKISKWLMSHKSRYILHHYRFWAKCTGEPKHFLNEAVPKITIPIGAVSGAQRRKALTGRTSGEKVKLARAKTQFTPQACRGQLTNIGMHDRHVLVIGRIGSDRGRINFNGA